MLSFVAEVVTLKLAHTGVFCCHVLTLSSCSAQFSDDQTQNICSFKLKHFIIVDSSDVLYVHLKFCLLFSPYSQRAIVQFPDS